MGLWRGYINISIVTPDMSIEGISCYRGFAERTIKVIRSLGAPDLIYFLEVHNLTLPELLITQSYNFYFG
jgi:hypothetical protein